jgi:hypothetical protein
MLGSTMALLWVLVVCLGDPTPNPLAEKKP